MFSITRKLPTDQKQGLYCVWVRRTERPGAPLVCLWIDPTMSSFRANPSGEAIHIHAADCACAVGEEDPWCGSTLRFA